MNKKATALLCLILLLATTLSTSVCAFASNSVSIKTAYSSELKEKASNSAKTITNIRKNTSVKVEGFTSSFYKIVYTNGKKSYKGYISKSKIKKNKSIFVLSNDSLHLTAGKSATLSAANLAGTNITKNATWSSNNKNVATINNGKITTVGIGKATISAKYNGVTRSCEVTVAQAKPKKEKAYKTNYTCFVYKTANSSSKKVAKLKKSASLNLISKNKNWCKVSCTYKSKKVVGYIPKKALNQYINTKHTLTKKIEITPAKHSVSINESIAISAKLMPVNATNEIVWTTSNKNIFTVSNGVAKAVSTGSATITATSGKYKSTITLRCILPAKSISPKEEKIPLAINEGISAYDYIKATPSNAYDYIKVTSSNNKIAYIVGNTIYGKSEGIAKITVTESSHTMSFYVDVHSVSTNAENKMELRSEDGDLTAYHPKCLYFENGWNGYKYWITYSPYTNGNDYYENPHVLASNDLQTWEEPNGFKNPVEGRPDNWKRHTNYNSDPELVYNSDTNELECWWRYYNSSHKQVVIYRKRTSNGVNWLNKEAMITGDINKEDYLSPALVYEDGIYKMWTVDMKDNYKIKYLEYNSNNKAWSKKRTIKIKYTNPILSAWHLGVIHTAKGYEMSISASESIHNHSQMNVYYCYSNDNINYSIADIMFEPARNTSKWDNKGIYRSSMMYANGKYYLFYSGVNTEMGPSGVGMISGDDPYHLK